jgi:hypothetical protein
MNRARVRKVVLALVVILAAMQIFQPRRTNPPVLPSRSISAHVALPQDVYSSLLRGCGDCHSDQTRWPWYSKIAPLSWVLTDDVNQGRRQMNFEDWEAQKSPKEANDHLGDICKEIQRNGMPPFSYRLLHPESKLKPEEVSSICAWSRTFESSQSSGVVAVP